MGMSQDQAQAQAYQDYYQLMAQQTQAANAVNAQTAQQNVDSQNKSNTGLIGAAGSIIGGIFSDERAKKDIEPTKERDLKEFLEAASKAREQEEEARNQAALRTVPLDARIASRMTPKQAERFKGFATLFASARDGMEAPASDQAQVSEQAPQRSGASNKNIEDERIRRLLEAYTSSPSIYQRTPDTDASYARLPKDWSPPPGATGFPVGFDRSKLKPGDLENPPSWPSARADTGEMLDSVNPVDFRYRDKSMGDGQQYGVIAQDLERSKIGRSLVRTDPATGYKAIDTDRGFGAVLAAQSELNKRIAALEEKKRRAA
jgi:hypothetical protein